MKYLYFLTILIIPNLITAQNLNEVGLFRAIWNQTGDPSTTMTIGLHDPTPAVSAPVIYYDVVDYGTTIASYTNSRPIDATNVYKGMNNGFFRLTGLQPDTRYYFVIVDDGLPTPGDEFTSARMIFDTAPNSPNSALSVLAGGDSRDEYENPLTAEALDPVQTQGRLNANKMVAKLRPDVVVFGGDMTLFDDVVTVPSALAALEWPRWFEHWQETISADGRITPIVVARGNHEYDPFSLMNLFDMADTDYHYAVSFGGNLLRLYNLNSEASGSTTQATFLETDLENNCDYIWKMAQYHKPTRPHEAGKSEQDDQRDLWSRQFDKHGVQLVVECDAHLCKYTYPISVQDGGDAIDEGFVRDDASGVVYIGEGGWGADLRGADDPKPWTLDHSPSSFNQIKWLWIDQSSIQIRTIQTAGADGVTALTDANRFTVPSGLQLWDTGKNETSPAGTFTINGPVFTLTNPHNSTFPSVDLGADGGFTSTATLDAGAGFACYEWNTSATTQTITITSTGTYEVTVTDEKGCTATDAVFLTRNAVLPIELIAFSGQTTGTANLLKWSTESERDNDYFALMVSKDGRDFQEIARVAGAGTTSKQQAYQFKDEFPISNLTYYRLDQYDFNGKMTQSEVISIQNKTLNNFSITSFYPNPTNGKASIQFSVNKVGAMDYQVVGLNGKLILQDKFQSQLGINQLNLDLENTPNGVYFLKMQNGDSEAIFKFIKK